MERGVHAAGRGGLAARHGAAHVRPAGGGVHEAVLAHQHGHPPGEGVHHLAVGRDGGVRPGGPEAGVLAVHDVGLDGDLRVVPDPEAVEGVGGVAVHEHVSGGDEGPEDLAARLGAQVEGDAALVLVDLEVRRAVVRLDLAQEVAEVVAPPGALDLDDVGAEVAQQRAEVVAVEQHRRLDDPDAREQALAHAVRSCSRMRALSQVRAFPAGSSRTTTMPRYARRVADGARSTAMP